MPSRRYKIVKRRYHKNVLSEKAIELIGKSCDKIMEIWLEKWHEEFLSDPDKFMDEYANGGQIRKNKTKARDKDMKYIRTKDGRIIPPISGDDVFDNAETQGGENVEKVSYAIVRLLDMCFVKRQYDSMYKLGTLYECACEIEVFKKKLKSNNPITAIYGLIMTFDETGAPTIKPVAKMNEKGEWELL